MTGSGELRINLSSHEVSPTEPPPLAGLAPGRWVRVEVTDTGPGMAPEVLARVFEPFFTTKEPGQGTGVGLNQVLRLVSEHEGHVGMASQPGVGTTVSIWLPAAVGGSRGSR
ncbi:MAG: ATP-binding protein [Actinomycetota bacterium]|nr:ATP-binding protein [Actinomycetota bacterium]MDQ3680546.1 ATP-binding protein [Actinomycetota bacterium]